ncbi:MAG: hypothetical protein CBE00_04125 [Planctomycetaceae bacterium TMED240]|nr:hypothetical protein [Rhodopirellula sp.]OUX07689.1 MAG: hypothetical protein CBE00_04125 [Planctomycetaceae bacterium TMED240]
MLFAVLRLIRGAVLARWSEQSLQALGPLPLRNKTHAICLVASKQSVGGLIFRFQDREKLTTTLAREIDFGSVKYGHGYHSFSIVG